MKAATSQRQPGALETTAWLAFRYYAVGALALGIDVTLFRGLIGASVPPVGAAALSYALAAGAHFLINRTWSFKAFDRSALSQARTYTAVLFVAWITTIAVVGFGTGVLHLSPLVSKALAIVVTLPMGFLGHRYLTFGAGVRAALRAAYLRCK